MVRYWVNFNNLYSVTIFFKKKSLKLLEYLQVSKPISVIHLFYIWPISIPITYIQKKRKKKTNIILRRFQFYQKSFLCKLRIAYEKKRIRFSSQKKQSVYFEKVQMVRTKSKILFIIFFCFRYTSEYPMYYNINVLAGWDWYLDKKCLLLNGSIVCIQTPDTWSEFYLAPVRSAKHYNIIGETQPVKS